MSDAERGMGRGAGWRRAGAGNGCPGVSEGAQRGGGRGRGPEFALCVADPRS